MEQTENTPSTETEAPLAHDEAAILLLNQAHEIGERVIASHEAFGNPGMYPFELTQMSVLLSIAHSLRSLNDKIELMLLATKFDDFDSTAVSAALEKKIDNGED